MSGAEVGLQLIESDDDAYTSAEEDQRQDEEPSTSERDSVLDREHGNHGCSHYRRRCLLVAPCCGEVFWCRHCHNAAKSDNEQDPRQRHALNRRAVCELVCALCNTRQPTGRSCISCGVGFGRYTCLKCNFFDDDVDKRQFHCEHCGICRVGGRENYFHCNTCNCCYAMSLFDSHVCIQNSMHHNCPVCFEYLFDSIKPINVMPCGHTIHQECLRNLADYSTYVCPVCFKSYMNTGSMQRVWDELDAQIQQTPMPQEYQDIQVNILCNDCQARSTVPFHVVGHKCPTCGGYNTRRI